MRVIALLFLSLTVTVSVGAHEGEQHAAPDIAAVSSPGSDLLAVGATSEKFELVVKYPAHSPINEVPLTFFLSDAPTNAPVADAKVEVLIPDAAVSLTLPPAQLQGIYRSTVVFPEAGSYDLIVTVTADGKVDLISLSGLQIGLANGEEGQRGWTKWGLGVGAALLTLAFAGVILRRVRVSGGMNR